MGFELNLKSKSSLLNYNKNSKTCVVLRVRLLQVVLRLVYAVFSLLARVTVML